MAKSSNDESHRTSAITSTGTGCTRGDKDASESKKNLTSSCSTKMIKISAWLIPPPDIFPKLQEEIEQLATANQTTSFPPHVTLVGGVEVDPAKMPTILMNFQESFQGFGPIPCKFNRERGVVAGYDDDVEDDDDDDDDDDVCRKCEDGDVRRKCKWNQTAVAVVHRDDKFIRSVKLSRRILLTRNDNDIDTTSTSSTCTPNVVVGEKKVMTPHTENHDDELLFKPPTNEPHFSLAYSKFALDHSVQDINIPPDFDSTEVVIFYTDPSTLEGVASWKELGRISTL